MYNILTQYVSNFFNFRFIEGNTKAKESFFISQIISVLLMCTFTATMLVAVVQIAKIMNKCMVTFAEEYQIKTQAIKINKIGWIFKMNFN
jgi:hypothetical protein